MKRAVWILCIAVLLGAIALVVVLQIRGRSYSHLPSIDFVHYRSTTKGMVGVFRVSNASGISFSYYGSAPAHPGYWYNIPHRGEWFPQPYGELHSPSGVSGWQHLPPHGSFEFEVPVQLVENPQLRSAFWWDVPPPPPNASFAVGLLFISGTPNWARLKEKMHYTPYIGDLMAQGKLEPEEVVLSQAAPSL